MLVEKSLCQQSHPDANALSYNDDQTSKICHKYSSGMNFIGVTNYFLTGFKACYKGSHATKMNKNL